MTSEENLGIEVRLSMLRALWDVVTPDLRGVAVSWTPDAIRARFLYDGRRPEQDELVSLAETYVLADFPPHVTTEFRAIDLPVPEPRDELPGEAWIYLRRESPD